MRFELIILFKLIVLTLGGYVFIWSITGALIGAVLGLGDPQRIVRIDNLLAKEVNKLHSNYQCMMSYSIISRFLRYCVAYPFIRHRAKNSSIKFKIFMWFNALGFWSWIGVFFCMFLDKGLGIIN